ncbi:hypothetical protein [Draconibacterium orientale]|uniref:hypothetical protein n=2 Tax=Draconibacterium orientale TaxID=1168034 RepID=UPI002ABE1156|nr:hypothetical protein [Draconibacterium orientale]
MMNSNQFFRKNTLLFFFLLLSTVALRAQSNPVIASITPGEYSTDWELFESTELVNIYYMYVDCSDPVNGVYPEQILFKVENKTNSKIYVYWDYVLEYNNKPTKSSPDENLVQVTLDANQSTEGNCANLHKTKLGIFYRYIDGEDVLTDFQFQNLSEHKLN